MAVSDIVQSNISIKDAVPSGQSFSVIGILAYHTHYVGWRTYSVSPDGLSAMATDGFAIYEPAYKMVQAMSAQNPKTDTCKIYARPVSHTKVLVLTPTDLVSGHTVSVDVSDGSGTYYTLSHVNGGSETATTICTALNAVFTAISPAPALSTTSAATLTVTGTGGHSPYIRNATRGLTVSDTTVDTDLAADCAAAQLLDSAWYGMLTDTTSSTAIQAGAVFAEANAKLYEAMSFDTAIIGSGTTDVAYIVKAAGDTHTTVHYSGDPGSYVNAGLLSREFSQLPGSSSWHMKQVNGVTADNLNATELANARGKNALVYVSDRGVNHTFDGKAASGRFLDITFGADWLNGRIQDDQIALQLANEKISFDKDGIGLIAGALDKSLDAGVQNQLVEPGYVINLPSLATISPTDKANRLLQLITWNGILNGAVNQVKINGVLTP